MREYLRERRKSKGLSQKDVAQKLNISESYYCLIENGERQQKINIDILSKLSEIFGVPFDELAAKEINRF